MIDCLRRCSLFASLPDEALERLAERAVAHTFSSEEVLFRTGDRSESVYVICSGHIRACVRSADGREVVLHVAGPGEAPGYLDLVDDGPRSTDAVADDDATVIEIPVVVARATLVTNPEALMDLARELVGIVRVLDRKVGEFVLLDLPARLARAILELPESNGVVRFGGTQSDLAAQLGVARQSLNRALGGMQDQGLIEVSGGGSRIEILDRSALAERAG